MLIFSVSFQIDQMPEGENEHINFKYIVHNNHAFSLYQILAFGKYMLNDYNIVTTLYKMSICNSTLQGFERHGTGQQ